LRVVEYKHTLVVFVMNYFYSSNQIYEIQKNFYRKYHKKNLCVDGTD
jgi:hypothetical protein